MPDDAPVISAHLSSVCNGNPGSSGPSDAAAHTRFCARGSLQALVAGAEDVGRVEAPLELALPFQGRRRQDGRQECLANLADAVMVRERAAAAQDFLAGDVLELAIDPRGV